MPPDTPAARLRSALAAKGWTQAELARRLGCSQPRVAAVLAGRPTTLDWLYDAAVAMGVRPSELDGRLTGRRG